MQNEADVQAYLDKNCKGNAANSKQGTGIKSGDLKFVDVNGDGVVNDDDKTELGDPHPDVTMGITLASSPMVSTRTSLQRCMTTGMVRELPTSILCSPT